jgi:hypothetical protein
LAQAVQVAQRLQRTPLLARMEQQAAIVHLALMYLRLPHRVGWELFQLNSVIRQFLIKLGPLSTPVVVEEMRRAALEF